MAGVVYKPPAEKPTKVDAPLQELTSSEAGSGVKRVDNPLASLVRNVTKEEYDAATPQNVRGSGSKKADDLIAAAKAMIGTPYKWGASGPLGVDCSGFTKLIYQKFGVDLPRVSYQQASAGKRIARDALRAGDLVFWDNSSRNNGADHVAIYIGNNQIIEAPKPGVPVRIRSLRENEGNFWGAAMNL